MADLSPLGPPEPPPAARATLAAVMQDRLVLGVRAGQHLAVVHGKELAVGIAALVAAMAVFLATHTAAGTRRPVNPPAPVAHVPTHPIRLSNPDAVYWGASIENSYGQAPWSTDAIMDFQRQAGKAPSIISWGSEFYSSTYCNGYCPFETAQFDTVRQYGAIPMFSWGPGWAQSIDAQIAAGAKDDYITQWAQAAKAWGHPFFLRFDWEMNGSWFPWGIHADGNSPADFVAMWRHVHDIFARVGATNVTWVWCPNVNAPTTYQPLAKLYPGNAYVDWTCLDGYNGDNPWLSFGALYGPSYSQVTTQIAPSKPLMIGEVSSTEAGGSKAAWISNMFTLLPTLFSQARAFVWFEGTQTGVGNRSDWEIESSPAAKAAFDTGISSPVYSSNKYASLDLSPIPPPQ